MSVGSGRLSRDNTNNDVTPAKSIKLISLLDALVKGVLKYLMKIPHVKIAKIRPKLAKTVISIPLTLFSCMLIIGSSVHFVRSSFDLCLCEHSVQLKDPWPVLMLFWGHLMHSQQHGVVGDFLVPGGHSSTQTDLGTLPFKLAFHTTFDSNESCGFAFFLQEPIKTFLYRFPGRSPLRKFTMSYDAVCTSPDSSNCTRPVTPSKLTL